MAAEYTTTLESVLKIGVGAREQKLGKTISGQWLLRALPIPFPSRILGNPSKPLFCQTLVLMSCGSFRWGPRMEDFGH